jgi:hypothetical protein
MKNRRLRIQVIASFAVVERSSTTDDSGVVAALLLSLLILFTLLRLACINATSAWTRCSITFGMITSNKAMRYFNTCCCCCRSCRSSFPSFSSHAATDAAVVAIVARASHSVERVLPSQKSPKIRSCKRSEGKEANNNIIIVVKVVVRRLLAGS